MQKKYLNVRLGTRCVQLLYKEKVIGKLNQHAGAEEAAYFIAGPRRLYLFSSLVYQKAQFQLKSSKTQTQS